MYFLASLMFICTLIISGWRGFAAEASCSGKGRAGVAGYLPHFLQSGWPWNVWTQGPQTKRQTTLDTWNQVRCILTQHHCLNCIFLNTFSSKGSRDNIINKWLGCGLIGCGIVVHFPLENSGKSLPAVFFQ